MKYKLINADCLEYMNNPPDGLSRYWSTIFADPPDNIGTKYLKYKDAIPNCEYARMLRAWLTTFVDKAETVWFSFNSKWIFHISEIVNDLLTRPMLEAKMCVQTFTFGQHNHHDLGNNFRPIIRLRWSNAPLYPDAIRVPSWRQLHGDVRADSRGRVPGDVFDFPRVTGNSRQRRKWHPTQLNEGLVERCIKLTTPESGSVLDPFGGTGTTLRVCKKLNIACTLLEVDEFYCSKIAGEHGLEVDWQRARVPQD